MDKMRALEQCFGNLRQQSSFCGECVWSPAVEPKPYSVFFYTFYTTEENPPSTSALKTPIRTLLAFKRVKLRSMLGKN